jgi:hypothetical protein
LTQRQVDIRIASGRWAIVHPGVYRIVGAPTTTRQRLFAATQWIGDCAMSHVAAGRLLRLESVPRPSTIDISCTRPTSKTAPAVAVHRTRLANADRVMVDGIPCTSATRTIVDLAATLDSERLETVFESARRLRLTSAHAIEQRAGDFCRQGKAGSGSVKELLRVLECDGFEHHGRRLVWKRDRRRIAAFEAAGWRLIQLTWDDVTRHPEDSVTRLRIALQRAVAQSRRSSALPRGSRSRVNAPNCTSKPCIHS